MEIINVRSSTTLREIATSFSKIALDEVDPFITVNVEQFVFNWKTAIVLGTACVLICKEGTETIGMFCGTITPSGWDSNQLMGREFFWWVKPEYRGRNAGRLLLDAFTLWAKGKGATDIIMISLREKPQVEKFYKDNGFTLLEKTWSKSISKGVN